MKEEKTAVIPLFMENMEVTPAMAEFGKADAFIKRLAASAKADADEVFAAINDADSFISEGSNRVMRLYRSKAAQCVKYLVDYGIYDCTESNFIYTDFFMEYYEKISDACIEVESSLEAKKQLRDNRKQTRSRMSGVAIGGGVGNAFKTYVSVGAVNAASGAAHGIVNSVGNMFSSAGAGLNKIKIFSNSSGDFRKAVYYDVFCGAQAMFGQLKRNGIDIIDASWENKKIAQAVYKNLTNLSFYGNGQRAYEMAHKIFATYPFEAEYYDYCIRHFPAERGNLLALAEYLNVDISPYADSILISLLTGTTIDTEEAADEWRERLFHFLKRTDQRDNKALDGLEKNLQAVLEKRTVRGIRYDSREEADKVRRDYATLSAAMGQIDFGSYNLLEQSNVEEIKSHLLGERYESDAFAGDQSYILNELAPVLDYYIQLQLWKEELIHSDEPWTVVEKMIRDSGIPDETKEKIRFWNFAELKKYYPALVEHERPLLYYRLGLFGWGQYFVLTNKRALVVKRNAQEAISLGEDTDVRYNDNQLTFTAKAEEKSLPVPFKCPESGVKPLMDIMELIVGNIRTMDETLFDVPDGFYPDQADHVSSSEGFTTQLKGIFQKGRSSFMKKGKTLGESQENVHDTQNSKGRSPRFCSQCGSKVNEGDKFCASCGNRL